MFSCKFYDQNLYDVLCFSDLDVYYEKHRGFDINYKPACKLMGTIARDIERVTRRSCDGKQCHVIPENTQIPNGFKHIMRVGHAETLLPVLASFNIVPTSVYLKN